MIHHELKAPPLTVWYWDRGNKRRPYESKTAALSIELGTRAYRCWTVEHRDGRTVQGQLEVWLGYVEERQRALDKRIAELDRLEAEIMAELS